MFNLQDSLKILDIEYKIDTDFKTWIEFYTIINLENDENKKLASLIKFLNKLGLPILKESLESCAEFFAGNKYNKIKETGIVSDVSKSNYCFKKDFKYIYSAFLEQYKIDLYVTNIHWHKFQALFSSLNDDCMFSKIIYYRSVELNKVPKEQKDFYQKMKKMFSLDDNHKKMTTKEYHKAIFDRMEKIKKEVIEDGRRDN